MTTSLTDRSFSEVKPMKKINLLSSQKHMKFGESVTRNNLPIDVMLNSKKQSQEIVVRTFDSTPLNIKKERASQSLMKTMDKNQKDPYGNYASVAVKNYKM